MNDNETDGKKKGAPRGRSFARGNKAAAKPAELHRVVMNVSVAPETAALLAELSASLGKSRGKLVDEALRLFAESEKKA